MSDEKYLITPEERIGLVPFSATKVSDLNTVKTVKLEDYSNIPVLDLDVPPMDHHLLIFNYNPPVSPVYHTCGEAKHNKRWNKNSCAYIPALCDNTWRISESGSGGLHILLPNKNIMEIIEDTCGFDPSLAEFESSFETQNINLSQLGMLIHNELHNDFSNGNLYIESLTAAISVQLIQNFSNRIPTRMHNNGNISKSGISRIIKYIDENLHEKITLEALSSELNLSVYYFSRAFKKTTGYSPFQFVIHRRANHAKHLLLTNKNKSIIDIALHCGFTDQSHMNKILKKVYKSSASEIRGSL